MLRYGQMLHQLVGGSAPADCPLRHAVPHKVRVLAQLGQVAYQLGYAYFGGQHSVRPVGIAPGEQLRVFPGAVLYGLPCEGQIFLPRQRRAQRGRPKRRVYGAEYGLMTAEGGHSKVFPEWVAGGGGKQHRQYPVGEALRPGTGIWGDWYAPGRKAFFHIPEGAKHYELFRGAGHGNV